jgi:hypothetical protein
MKETYSGEWNGTGDALRRDAFGDAFHVLVVSRASAMDGFIAWCDTYDLHWCMRGAVVIDLYARPHARGSATGASLICAAAAAIHADGGTFLKGGPVENAAVKRLYARSAVCNPGMDCTLSGRAFRRIAELSGKPAREIARSVPDVSWNYQP